MATAHLTVQGKGGVGKSKWTVDLTQYISLKGFPVICIDIDPVNHTYAGYKAFGARILNIMDGDNINARKFDDLMEIIITADPNTHVIVDSGASSFIQFMSYIKENNAIQLLKENGHDVYLHTIITGGQAILDTVSGLDTICKYFADDAKLCVVLNRYFGAIEYKEKAFEDFEICKQNHNKFHTVISLPHMNVSTFGKDIEELLARRETYDAAINSSLPIMARQRIKTYWRELQKAIDAANLLPPAE